MALILLLSLTLTALVRVETQTSSVQSDLSLARSNALLGLQVALGELQKAAGPDQRVTGTADLVDGLSDDSQRHWTGVWDVSSRDPFSTFSAPSQVSWLISGVDTSGDDLTPDATVKDPVALIEDTANSSNEVVAGLEVIEGLDASHRNGHFAYWVGDEGVKAKVNLSDPHRASSGQTSSDYHFSQMTGQRTGIEKVCLSDAGSAVIGDYLDPLNASIEGQLDRLASLDQLQLVDDDLAVLPANRIHDLTTASFGVLANVADGGLKKDLSLAFEMDLDDFNADTHFAKGGESLAPGAKGTITGHDIRYLFTHDYTKDGDGIRGPTWHMLRNFYRLYLQDDPDRFVDYKTDNPRGVVDEGGSYTIEARPFFPQTPDGSSSASYGIAEALYDIQYGYDINAGNFYDNGGLRRIPRPTDMQIAPVLTRMQLFMSLQAVKVNEDPVTGDFQYRIDLLASPLVTVWNPYNTALSFDTYKVSWSFLILPLKIQYKEPGGNLQTVELKLSYADDSKKVDNLGLSFTLKGTTLEPGQVKVFSHAEAVGLKEWTGGKSLTATLEPYSGSLELESEYFRFDQIRVTAVDDVADTVEAEELIVEPGTEIRVEGESGGGATGGYSDKLYIRSDLVWGSRSAPINLSNGVFRNPTGAREFYWPEEDPNYFGAVEDIAEDREPYRHPLGLIDTYLKPTGAIDMNHPVQFMARYNPRSMSQVRLTGGYNNGYDFPIVGNWCYNISSFTDWYSDIIAVDTTTGNGFWGEDNRNGAQHVVLFELPTAPLQSLAAFQHVNNISRYAQEPAYVVGNSYASPFIDSRNVTERLLSKYTQVDWSYFCNEALWDDYYFSSLSPREDLNEGFEARLESYLAGESLPDSRMTWYGDSTGEARRDLLDSGTDSGIDAEAYMNAAKHFMVNGAFNVNSTSVEAWKAMLASANGIDMAYLDGNSLSRASSQVSPYSRMSLPGGDSADVWRGFRSLSDLQVTALAEAIVDQVKLRGPFTSLADFVNRRLSSDDSGLMGPLQAALNSTALNSDFTAVVTEGDLEDSGITYPEGSNIPYPQQAIGATEAAATGYLQQGDLLMSLGPVLSARSDTFTIRAYGDYEDPITGRKVTARCEAIVQRLPEYVDPTDAATLGPLELTSNLNQDFGRRFVVRSIQWLD
ncbi:hypothetical protein [Coraliomargarita parva]|uniref:hypothetical protein n=1 Tax=Coraliomargarita parva TaxID=3014050 RepID=UPI0022B39303|nr:hypothetical protein [Coraliomargarita parva]